MAFEEAALHSISSGMQTAAVQELQSSRGEQEWAICQRYISCTPSFAVDFTFIATGPAVSLFVKQSLGRCYGPTLAVSESIPGEAQEEQRFAKTQPVAIPRQKEREGQVANAPIYEE